MVVRLYVRDLSAVGWGEVTLINGTRVWLWVRINKCAHKFAMDEGGWTEICFFVSRSTTVKPTAGMAVPVWRERQKQLWSVLRQKTTSSNGETWCNGKKIANVEKADVWNSTKSLKISKIGILKLLTYLLVWFDQNQINIRSAVQWYFPLQRKWYGILLPNWAIATGRQKHFLICTFLVSRDDRIIERAKALPPYNMSWQNVLGKYLLIVGPWWWWLRGQRARILLQWNEFESCWSLQFFSVNVFLESSKINKRLVLSHFLKKCTCLLHLFHYLMVTLSSSHELNDCLAYTCK